MYQEKLLKRWSKSRVSAVRVQTVAKPTIIGCMARNTQIRKTKTELKHDRGLISQK